MKKKYCAGIAICAMMLATGCSNEEVVEQTSNVNGDFSLKAEIGVESRTYIDEAPVGSGYEYQTYWSKSDQIYIASMNGSSHAVLTLASDPGLTTGYFTGDLFGDPRRLEYAVFPKPNNDGYIDMTTRPYNYACTPMVGGYDTTKKSVNFANQTAMIRLYINDFPGGDFTVKGDDIAGLGTVVKNGNGYVIDFKNNQLSDVITVKGAPAGQSEFFVPIVVDPTATVPVMKNLTVKIGDAEITKNIGLGIGSVTYKQEPDPKTGKIYAFLDLTYHADTKELTEKWDGGITTKTLDLTTDPVEIHDAAQLYALSQAVLNGENFQGKTIKLINDIDLNNKNWEPIGQEGAVSFRGVFDGNGKTISNLQVSDEDAGLFGKVWGATIKNLTIENATVAGSERAGQLMAYVHGSPETSDVPTSIENVTINNATVTMGDEEVTDYFGAVNESAVILINGKEYLTEGVSTDTENENALYITSVKGLLWFAEQVNGGESFEGKTIELGADIDLENKEWAPVGTDAKHAFRGTFNGNAKTISNLKITEYAGEDAGFFGLLCGSVSNLTLDNVTIVCPVTSGEKNFYAGALAGRTYGNLKFNNIRIMNSKIQGSAKSGGLIANVIENQVEIENCHVIGSTVETVNPEDGGNIGGFIGYIHQGNSVIKNSSVEGCTINAVNSANEGKRANSKFVGAFGGYDDTSLTFENCSVEGTELNEKEHTYVNPYGTELVGGRRVEETGKVIVDGFQVVGTAVELEAVVNRATTDIKVAFGCDIEGNVIINQEEGENIVIDGKKNNYDGTIEIYGHARYEGAETLTLKNINFKSNKNIDFISCNTTESNKRYAHNVTLDGCDFSGVDGVAVVGLRIRQGYNFVIKNCVANNLHSLVQMTAMRGLTFDNVDIEGKSGINLLTSAFDVEVKNSRISVKPEEYGIRLDANASSSLTVNNCELIGGTPFVFRKSTAGCIFKLTGNNKLTPDTKYHIDVQSGVAPTMEGVDGLNISQPQ